MKTVDALWQGVGALEARSENTAEYLEGVIGKSGVDLISWNTTDQQLSEWIAQVNGDAVDMEELTDYRNDLAAIDTLKRIIEQKGMADKGEGLEALTDNIDVWVFG
jgi:hypothetical protein